MYFSEHIEKKKRSIFFGLVALFIFFWSTYFSYSINKIEIKDTVIYQGVISEIPVYANFDIAGIESIMVVFEYNSKGLEIKKAVGGTNYIYKCPEALINKKFDNLEKAEVSLYCSDISDLNTTLFVLNVEGLVAGDSIFSIYPKELWINGSKITDFQYDTTKIIVRGTIIYPVYDDELGMNYPNPFYSYTKIPFALKGSSKVNFKIYSLAGDLVYELPSKTNSNFKIFKVDENIEIQNFDDVFKKGKYILEFYPDLTVSQGIYYVVFITDNNVYYRKIFLLKP